VKDPRAPARELPPLEALEWRTQPDRAARTRGNCGAARKSDI